eukprot:gb/GEZN01000373.1/.p1 GENE.gb/GEZN01000373.1/~~gb/GEZN01000373.1/.p1  ORF type:complete len:1537 (-),score=251.89 gb/GEZN01000373.1/:33-4643(-)
MVEPFIENIERTDVIRATRDLVFGPQKERRKTKHELAVEKNTRIRTFHYRVDKIHLEFEAKVDKCFLEFEIGGRTKEAEGQVTESEKYKKKDPATGEVHEIERPVYRRQLRILRDPAQRWYSRSLKRIDPKIPMHFEGEALTGTWVGSLEDLELESITIRLWQYRLLQPNYLIGTCALKLKDIARGATDLGSPIFKYQMQGLKIKELVGNLRFECEFQETQQFTLDLRDWEISPQNDAALYECRKTHDLCLMLKCPVTMKHAVRFHISEYGPERSRTAWDRAKAIVMLEDGLCGYHHQAYLDLIPDQKTDRLEKKLLDMKLSHGENIEDKIKKLQHSYTGGLSSRQRQTELQYTGAWSWLEDESLRVELRQGFGLMCCWCSHTLGVAKVELQGVLDYGYVITEIEGIDHQANNIPKWNVKGALLNKSHPDFRQLSTMGPNIQRDSLRHKFYKRVKLVTPDDATYLVVRVKSAKGLFNPLPNDYSETINPSVTVEWRTIQKHIPQVKNTRDPYWSNGEVHFKLAHHRQVTPPSRFSDFHKDYRNSSVTLSVWDNHDLSKAPLGYCTIPFEEIYRLREEKSIKSYASDGEERNILVYHKWLPLHTHFAVPDGVGKRLLRKTPLRRQKFTAANPSEKKGKANAPANQEMKDNGRSSDENTSEEDDDDDDGFDLNALLEDSLADRRAKVEVEIYFDRTDNQQVPIRSEDRTSKVVAPYPIKPCTFFVGCCCYCACCNGLCCPKGVLHEGNRLIERIDGYATSVWETIRGQLRGDDNSPLETWGPAVADLSRQDLVAISSYWNHIIRFVPQRRSRFFPIVGRDEWTGQIYYLPCFLISIVPPRDLRQFHKVFHLVYSIEFQQRPKKEKNPWLGTTNSFINPPTTSFAPPDLWIWTDPYFFLEKRKGDIRAHAILLASFLMGLKNQGQQAVDAAGLSNTKKSPIQGVYVCIGTVRVRGKPQSEPTPHIWVMTLEKLVLDSASHHPSADTTTTSSTSSSSFSSSTAAGASLSGESIEKKVDEAKGEEITKVVRFWETTNGRTYPLFGEYFGDRIDDNTPVTQFKQPPKYDDDAVAALNNFVETNGQNNNNNNNNNNFKTNGIPLSAMQPGTGSNDIPMMRRHSDCSDDEPSLVDAVLELEDLKEELEEEKEELQRMLGKMTLGATSNGKESDEGRSINTVINPTGLQQDLYGAQEEERHAAARQEWIEVRRRLDENEASTQNLVRAQQLRLEKARQTKQQPTSLGDPEHDGYGQTTRKRKGEGSAQSANAVSEAWGEEADSEDRRGYQTPYVTIDVVFNDEALFCNLQNPDPEVILYNFKDPKQWAQVDPTSLEEMFGLKAPKPFFPVRALSSIKTPIPDSEKLETQINLRVKDSLSSWRSYRLNGRIHWLDKFKNLPALGVKDTPEEFLKKRLKNEEKHGGGMFCENVVQQLDRADDEPEEEFSPSDADLSKDYAKQWRLHLEKECGTDWIWKEKVVYFKHSDLNRLTKGLIQHCEELLSIPKHRNPKYAFACNLERMPGQISPVRVILVVIFRKARAGPPL